jgi:hypothetical protein
MSLYCYIKDNQVVTGPRILPENWENVSNFYLLPNDIIKTYGWVPYIKVTDDKPVIMSVNREVFEDRVVDTFITRDKTQEEIEEENNEILQNKWNDIRRQRNELLSESDRYALIDVWNSLSEAKQQEWSTYRQQLRDLPQNYNDPDAVVFPTVPN